MIVAIIGIAEDNSKTVVLASYDTDASHELVKCLRFGVEPDNWVKEYALDHSYGLRHPK